jgi:quercetin dioxygenase-like cupin family protein
MKSVSLVARLRQICWAAVAGSFAVAFQCTIAAELKEARVTYMVNDVALLPPQAAPRPAKVPDVVRDGTAVRTGTDSRSELTFTDLTITRLGANTIFSFNEGTRNLDLKDGAILLRVPKNVGGAKITTAAVTAAITGTTLMMEFHPHGFIKAIGLEGVFRMYLRKRPGESVLVHAGQMVVMPADATRLPDPVDVDLKQLLKTSLLITGFPPLPSATLIAQAAQTQAAEKASGQLVATNLVIFGSGTVVSLLDQTNIDQISQAVVALTPGAPSKLGPPATITSFNPYPITNTTVITTDPTITTNGITDFGKIYRGPGEDGAFSDYAFGSTSTFDTEAELNSALADPVNLPVAVFKFQSLSLLGNPTISLGDGGPTKLFLLAENGINSGPPGGTLTFSGLDTLGLATVDGAINLTSDISFDNLPFLFIYARGARSNLTLASPITGSAKVFLNSEGAMRLLVGITATDQLKFIAGGDLIATAGGGIAQYEINNVGGTIGNGGNLTLQAAGNIAGQPLRLLVDNSTGGRINSGGNISVTTGGNLLVGSVDAFVNNRNGGIISPGGNITFDIGGALTTQQNAPTEFGSDSLFLVISNRNDGSGGGRMGGNVALELNAASVSVGGNLLDVISTNFGGSIAGNANLAFTTGDLIIAGDADFGIQNFGSSTAAGGTINRDTVINLDANSVSAGGYLDVAIFNDTGFGGPAGGTIGRDALVNVVANNISTTDFFEAGIFNYLGHHIGGNAIVNVNVAGTISGSGGIDFGINNFDNGAVGGTIGSNVITTVHATNISSGGDLQFFVDNEGGQIGDNAIITLAAPGNIIAAGDLSLDILNEPNGESGSPGAIGGAATIAVNARNITANSLTAEIDNSGGGAIGGGAVVAMNVSGKATVTTDATLAILGSVGAAAAAVLVNGGSYTAGGTFLGFIDGDGAITFNNASVHANALNAGVFGSNGVLRIGGGSLSADSVLKLYAPGSNGQLNFVSNVTLSSGTAMDLAANTITIQPSVLVTIAGTGGAANIYTNNANYSGFGGTNPSNGTFGGNGANPPQPLANAPAFDDPPPPATLTTTSGTTSTTVKSPTLSTTAKKTTGTTINVSSSGQLLSLLDGAALGPDGKIMISGSKSTSNLKNLSGMNINGLSRAERRMLIQQMRDRGSQRVGGRRIL